MAPTDYPFASQLQHQTLLEIVKRLEQRVKALEAVLLTVADSIEAALNDPDRATELAKELRATVMNLGPHNP